MPQTIYSAQLTGLDAEPIRIEVDITPGLYLFSLVGLADKEVQESKERIAAAIKNIGALAPHKRPQRVIVNLAPADLKKEGPLFDVPIALGYLLASGQANFHPEKKLFIGELGLDGTVRPVRGALAIATLAKSLGYEELYLPSENGAEASLISEMKIFAIESLQSLLDHLEERLLLSPLSSQELETEIVAAEIDLAEIHGQEEAKRALEIAASGHHNILLHGPPGTGKTLLAKSLISLLPPPSLEEAIEITKIQSAVGLTRWGARISRARPFRAPHHTASPAAVIGGGSTPRPGEISLAHRGVLFLDEIPEFQRAVLEALREPLEEHTITVARMQGSSRYPSDFILVAAMNPCPCGNLGNPQLACVCTPGAISKYQRKISGPLLDRIDIHIHVPNLPYEKLAGAYHAESSAAIRNRVIETMRIQAQRFQNESITKNSEMTIRHLKKYAALDEEGRSVMRKAVEKYALSARSYHRVLKLARTIADLANEEHIRPSHLYEALRYRPNRES